MTKNYVVFEVLMALLMSLLFVESYSSSSGCSDGSDDAVFISNKIVGCSGSFTGGLFGLEAKSLCNEANGWSICKNEGQVIKLGLTNSICKSQSPLGTFWATQQRSGGNALCDNNGQNDVFGCSRSDTEVGREFKTKCSILQFAIQCNRNFPLNNNQLWRCSQLNGFHELVNMNKYSMNGGGVMCCREATTAPSSRPTNQPTSRPTWFPTWSRPTSTPTKRPTLKPTSKPLSYPVPLYRYYNGGVFDHFYITNQNELAGRTDYKYEGIACYIFAGKSHPNLVALHRYYSGSGFDHFYTTTGGAVNGYVYEGVIGYCARSQMQGSVPLHGYYYTDGVKYFDHLYTTNQNELAGRTDYRYQGITCWVWPNRATGLRRRLLNLIGQEDEFDDQEAL